ncbi:DegV family protein [Eubacteriales bacterium OttesenSCG-928-N13]|nr:DegV family protein [Eubacteriales bacterium OttesenSCG-928-N13]
MNIKNTQYRITTDNMSDLSPAFLKEHEVEIVSLSYTIGDEVFNNTNSLTPKEFFDRMRHGAVPTSSQFNPDDASQMFDRVIEEHDCDIVHISFSTGMSGCYGSAVSGAEMTEAKYPGRRVVVIDSLCGSLGQGLLLDKALQQQKKGASMDELISWLERNKRHVCHLLTVEDIIYLYRGGRVSRTAAFVSGVLGIKPMIHVNDEGRLVPYGKVRGRKKSLFTLLDDMAKHIGNSQNDTFYITHGDCLEDAQFMVDQVRERFGITASVIEQVGPTIGAHTGPGLIAIFFMGDYR